MMNRLIVGTATMLLLSVAGCKQRSEESGVLDATGGAATPAAAPAAPGPKCSAGEQIDAVTVAGVGYVGTACGGSTCGGPNNFLTFRKIDRMSREACSTVARSLPLKSFGPFEITIPSGVKIPLTSNDKQNYSYTANKVPCSDAMQLLGMTTGFTSGEDCSIQLDTEDQYWFGITVRPESMSTNPGYDATVDDANKTFLATYSGPSTVASPLLPFQQINAKIDPAVKDEMIRLHNKYQMNSGSPNSNAHRERNSCLRNARANGWLDVQAHYYCIMPYDPHRKCYSTELVIKTETLKKARESGQVKITDIQYAMKVREFMEESLGACRNKPGLKDFTDDQIAIFKYVMFTIGGVMDFNIEAENELVNNFYSEIKATDTQTQERPTRILDPLTWRADQKRYADARAVQAPRVKLGLAKRGCMTTGGTWDDATRACACARGQAFNPQLLRCE
jgi:hypothetical protein